MQAIRALRFPVQFNEEMFIRDRSEYFNHGLVPENRGALRHRGHPTRYSDGAHSQRLVWRQRQRSGTRASLDRRTQVANGIAMSRQPATQPQRPKRWPALLLALAVISSGLPAMATQAHPLAPTAADRVLARALYLDLLRIPTVKGNGKVPELADHLTCLLYTSRCV